MAEQLMFDIVANDTQTAFITTSYKNNNEKVCEAKVTVEPSNGKWTICSWYTTGNNGHKGYGTQTLKQCLLALRDKYGLPQKIEYIWNGSNTYVFDWMNKHFGAISKCPIAVQKYQCDDDWESHIYTLNREKFINFFQLAGGGYGKNN